MVLRAEPVLVVLDAPGEIRRITELLARSLPEVHHALTLREALLRMDELDPVLVLVSTELAELPGPRVVRLIKERFPRVAVVALAGNPTTSDAVGVVRAGGDDYLALPVSPDRLEQAVSRALRDARAERALRDTQDAVRDRYGFKNLLSRSPPMLEVFDQIEAVAPTDATVLVLGETGTGKELVARAIHDQSRREAKAFVSVNCGAFSESLLESELFGHERGSFTGAMERREGVFVLADGGTLFLDELGDTSIGLQVKLLRVLEQMSFRRVGGEKLVTVDVRIVAATNVDLELAVQNGAFRDDLYWRLNVFPIRLPPLRQRREDIPVLLRHFLEGAARDYEVDPPVISADALSAILAYRWPGNVRQLRAMAERWVIQARGRTLLREDLPGPMLTPGSVPQGAGVAALDDAAALGPQLAALQAQLERDYLHRVLLRYGGHLQRAADHAGFTRRTLYARMKELGLDAAVYKRAGRDD